MKPKSLHLEAYTISETAKRLGYKSTKTIYRLLKRDLLEDYIYLERSGRVYLVLEPQNLPSDEIKLDEQKQPKKSFKKQTVAIKKNTKNEANQFVEKDNSVSKNDSGLMLF